MQQVAAPSAACVHPCMWWLTWKQQELLQDNHHPPDLCQRCRPSRLCLPIVWEGRVTSSPVWGLVSFPFFCIIIMYFLLV